MNSVRDHLTVGFPHSEIVGSKPARGSPTLIAACYVLHRLSVPRHPRNALMTLDRSYAGVNLAENKNSANVCITVLLPALAGRPHPRAWPPPQWRLDHGPRDHDQDCNNPDQEKPIHDDKEPCVNLTQRLRQCRRQGSFHFPTDKQFKASFDASLRCAGKQQPTPWWSQSGSNRRPQACKASALPTELWPRYHGQSFGGPGRT